MFSKLAALTLSLWFWSVVAVPTAEDSSLERRARASVYSKCTVAKTVALTFDDGPYVYAYDIVKALDAAGAKGTFFVNGNNYRCIYDEDSVKRVKYVYNHGHQLASHTWAHKDLTTLSWDNIHDEMWRVEQALVRITGAYPAFMRPPYGNYNNLVLDASGIRGQSVVIWDFDSEDSLGASVATSENLYKSRISAKPSSILALNHETVETTAHQVLPYAIQRLQAAGYKLVTLAECLGKKPYQSVVAPSTRDSSWVC
ncbi:carbohydrate esterase family 4 protein [Hypholoma sublateritium FD-334 SS-4]|uniref:Carbohydrate esterase family 4 protein n=1 Tax=Hypholoma sublateritium (strain FD-334 SS-4) TaxID=945553 RepID=A0A0D2L2R6_HYPSF|nr:carbohydrate esterase family 4 protein [Hypholoma sublateritium FD-334 SS-4]